MSNCKIENCENEIVYFHLRVCGACYAGLAYWRGRTKRDKEKRLEQIKRLNGRMLHMIDHPSDHPRRAKK